MDKILRRVRMVERQAARRAKHNRQVVFAIKKHDRLNKMTHTKRQAGIDLGAAIKARHEDLELGPLAPRRDVSQIDEYGNYWGTISAQRALLHDGITDVQREARTAWAGGTKYLCLAPGDRVVVTEGPFKGKIATIAEIKREPMAVQLDGNVAIVNASVPAYMLDKGEPLIQQVNSLVPISAVRLVHPLADPVTGVARDVIIRELKPVGIKHDRPTRKFFFSRIVPGLNVRIPWPKQKTKAHETHDNDTVRLDVEERTFVPTLLRPPMPESVLDELRGKYSKFRTRHTPEYIAEVERREAEKKANQKGARAEKMLLPVQEYNRKMREQRRERGQPELSAEMLEKIGEVIAKNRLVRSAGQGATAADAQVDKVQKAVEELSLGGDAQGTTVGGDQPRA